MKFNVQKLQEFFFEAALATYASGKKADPFLWLAGAKHFRYQREEFCYIDTYVVNGEHSGGQTIIWVNGVTAWLMQYHGWCQNDNKEVLYFLKNALFTAYKRSEFHGGRGIPRLVSNSASNLVYENWPDMMVYTNHDFTHFAGREYIWRKPMREKDIFWHRYQGLLLGEAE